MEVLQLLQQMDLEITRTIGVQQVERMQRPLISLLEYMMLRLLTKQVGVKKLYKLLFLL
jgi:hypothetical protein